MFWIRHDNNINDKDKKAALTSAAQPKNLNHLWQKRVASHHVTWIVSRDNNCDSQSTAAILISSISISFSAGVSSASASPDVAAGSSTSDCVCVVSNGVGSVSGTGEKAASISKSKSTGPSSFPAAAVLTTGVTTVFCCFRTTETGTSTLRQRKGQAPQPSITFSCQAGGGGSASQGGWVLHANTFMTP